MMKLRDAIVVTKDDLQKYKDYIENFEYLINGNEPDQKCNELKDDVDEEIDRIDVLLNDDITW